MDFRQWSSFSCVAIAGLWSSVGAIAVEDDIVVDEAMSRQTNRREMLVRDLAEGRDRLVVEAHDRVVVVQLGQKRVLNRANLVKLGDGFVKVSEFNNKQFDLQLFGHDNSPQKLKNRLNDELQASINGIDLVCELTPTQKKKLEMIGRADAKKLFDQVEELRARCRDSLPNGRPRDEEVQIFRTKLFGSVLGAGSFYQRSLPTVLTEGQFKKYSAKQSPVFSVPDPGQDLK